MIKTVIKLIIYNLLFPFAFLVYLPFFIKKLKRRGGSFENFGERFGIFSASQRRRLRTLRRPIWIHAVSVGEVITAVNFIDYWRQSEPDMEFVLSTTTTTGHATARKKLPEDIPLIYCPLDFFLPVLRSLLLIKPRMLIIFEVEIWPNLICLADWLKIPVTLVNGRISDRSALGYARHRWFFRSFLQQMKCICVQSEDDAERIKRITGMNAPVYVCNTMKFDLLPNKELPDHSALLNTVFGDAPPQERIIWIAGSTHAGEEDLVLRIFKKLKNQFPGLKLILAPRHQERSEEVEKTLVDQNISYQLRERKTESKPETQGPADVLLLNTTGELQAFYKTADIVYIGKSLAGHSGGHNIIEPAFFGKPVVHGRNMSNFRLVTNLFQRENGSIAVSNETELQSRIRELINNPETRKKAGQRALIPVKKYSGAMKKTIKHLNKTLKTGT